MKERQNKDRRRQYRSCDRCRSGKRACDATYESVAEAINRKVSCSNCKKKGKTCTFQYVLSILGGVPTGADPQQLSFEPSRASTVIENENDSASSESGAETMQPRRKHGTSQSPPEVTAIDFDWTQAVNQTQIEPRSQLMSSATAHDGSLTAQYRSQTNVSEDLASMQATLDAMMPSHGQAHQQAVGPVGPSGWTTGWCLPQANGLFPSGIFAPDVSFHSSNERLAANLDRIYLNDGLIRVYEGAAEQALRCWVTSSNTPYMLERTSSTAGIKPAPNHRLVYWRICELDRGARALLGRESATDEKEIMEAFHAVILAFAAQWAPHWVRGMAAQSNGSTIVGGDGAKSQENRVRLALWERAREKLQKVSSFDSFRVIFALIVFAWTEKPREVQERAQGNIDIDIYDENCALDTSSWQSPAEGSTLLLVGALRKLLSIRFKVESKKRRGLSPWVSPSLPGQSKSASAHTVNDTCCESSDVQKNLEGRKDLSEAEHEADSKSGKKSCNNVARRSQADANEVKRMEDTYHMLYWLGVVIDTETAVLRKHPPVVCDEDSELLSSVPGRETLNDLGKGCKKGIWDDWIIDISKHKASDFSPVWPCSEAQASATLAFSTPVKVVLFRQISRLQMSFWRRASPEVVEQHINSGLAIINHWNQIYGPLLDSCRESHGCLPPSIQSWYVLIAFPWYLAVLLFVEMVQTVDMAGSSDRGAREGRAQSGVFPRLRDQACLDMAALIGAIQATDFAHGGTFEFVRDSGGTILHTEPWAEIMVHSVSAVAKTEIRLHDGFCSQFKWRELEESKARVEKCLWALEQLSDRSPSASLAHEQLSDLAQNRVRQQLPIQQIPMASPLWSRGNAPATSAAMTGESPSTGVADSLSPISLSRAVDEYGATGRSIGGNSQANAAALSTADLLQMFLFAGQGQGQGQEAQVPLHEIGGSTRGSDVSSTAQTAASASHLFDSAGSQAMGGLSYSGSSIAGSGASVASTEGGDKVGYASSPSGAGECFVQLGLGAGSSSTSAKGDKKRHGEWAGESAKRLRREEVLFVSPPLQLRPTRAAEQMEDEDFYVDNHHAAPLASVAKSAAVVKAKAVATPGHGMSAATPVHSDVDWSSIFSIPS